MRWRKHIRWLLRHRWPVLLILPLFASTGDPWPQALAFAGASILITELLHACVLRVLKWQ